MKSQRLQALGRILQKTPEQIDSELQSGMLCRKQVELAAYLGSTQAIEAISWRGTSFLDDARAWDAELENDGTQWIDNKLTQYGRDVLVRAAVAKDNLYASTELPNQTTWLFAVEKWLTGEEGQNEDELIKLSGQSYSTESNSAGEVARSWAIEALCSAYVNEAPLQTWIGEISKELIPWLLNEYDPVVQRINAREG